MKTQFVATLSKDSFGKIAKQVQLYKQRYKTGIQLGVEEATKRCYEIICKMMNQYNLSSHISNVKWEYNSKMHVGKVYTTDIVIIFHEFGTGAKGTQDEWANAFGYKVNQSGKGDKGWNFYNENRKYGGITHGLTSKHIFYQAMLTIQKQLSETVNVYVSKTVGAMY